MDKREKVIKGLTCCDGAAVHLGHCQEDCPYLGESERADKCVEKLHSDALSLLKAQEPGWISVKDKMPDRNTQYLIALSTGGVTSGWYFGDCGGFFVAGVCITENVSYWQQLPEPPKED